MAFYKTLSLYNVTVHQNKTARRVDIYSKVLDCPAIRNFITLLKRNSTKTEVEQLINIYVEFTSKDGSYLYNEFDGFINNAGGRLNAASEFEQLLGVYQNHKRV